MGVSSSKIDALIDDVNAQINKIPPLAAGASTDEKKKRIAALKELQRARAALQQLRAEAAADEISAGASKVSKAAVNAEKKRIENTLAALGKKAAKAIAHVQTMLREFEPKPVAAGEPVEVPDPPVVEEPVVNDPIVMRRTSTGHVVFGHLVREMQSALNEANLPGAPDLTLDMQFGPNSTKALLKWHEATKTRDEAAVSVSEWMTLTGDKVPDLFDFCAQVTAAFEGHGFTKAVGDFDGAVATWGYHGFTLKYGHLQNVLKRTEKAQPGILKASFGADAAKALKDMLKMSLKDQIAWGKANLLDNGKMLKSWRDGFENLGNQAACRAAQLAYSRSEFWEKIALPQVELLGVKEALSHAILFDTAIQQGGLNKKRMALVKKAMSANPGMSEEDIRAEIAKAAQSGMSSGGFRDDVKSRRETFVDGTGRVHGKTYNLSSWGLVAAFDEQETEFADATDPAETPVELQDADNFTDFFEQNIKLIAPNFSASEFLTAGASNAPGGKCAGKNTPPPKSLWPRAVDLAKVLQEFRNRVGKAVRVHSMYRSPAYNDCIGGAKKSQHKEFRAADISVAGMKPSELRKIMEKIRKDGVFRGGIGTYKTFIHVDTRGENANWTG